MAFSSTRRNKGLVSLTTLMLLRTSMFLTQLLACPCGSRERQ